MNLKIIETKENPLLKRKELIVKIGSEGATPKKTDLIDKLSAVLDSKAELFSIETIKQKFGSKESIAIVNHYDSEEDRKKIECAKKDSGEKKNERPENVPDESGQIKVDLDEPSEEKSEDKPKESKSEEKKQEEKKEEPKEEKEESKKEQKEEKEKVAPKEKEEKPEQKEEKAEETKDEGKDEKKEEDND